MQAVEFDWLGDERDLDMGLADFEAAWSDQDFTITKEDDKIGFKDIILVTVESRMSRPEFEAMVEGTSNAMGLLDYVNEYTSGTYVGWDYV